jgi:hypothetical protein
VPDYIWKPIEPLADQDKRIDLAAIHPLYDSWRTSKKRLLQSSEASLRRFTERLVRRLSIETGILERLYDLDRGTTEALVAKGFLEDLVSHSATDIEPSRLIDILRDQEGAVQLVIDCGAGKRELTMMHERHAILAKHQDTTTAIDQFGNRREIPLLKGRFKQHPNNPKRPDGSIHEYSPPVHVDSEVDNLLACSSLIVTSAQSTLTHSKPPTRATYRLSPRSSPAWSERRSCRPSALTLTRRSPGNER